MPANKVILSLLSQASLFGGVPADDLEACAVAFAKMHFAKGKTLVVRGDPSTHLYLVEDGVRPSISTVKDRKPAFATPGRTIFSARSRRQTARRAVPMLSR